MWHTGQRSHVCPHCNKAFFQKGHLTQHLMIHSGGRPHECQQCHKTFIFKFDLNRHMKIHQERGYSCQQCGRSFLKQVMLDEHHLKCKGKPSSPSRSSLSSGTSATSAFNPVLAADHIAKMAQRLREQQQQNSAFTSLLIEQNKQNNNNLIPPPLFCVICKSSFTNQSAFAIHTYMHHLTTVPPPVLDTTVAALGSNSTVVGPGAILGSGNGSDVDPATDTSCASSPQKASPLQLESCLESSQSSVSPSSSSTTSGRISEPGCKDCNGSWLKIQELETKIDKKNEEFDTYRHMVKMIVSSVSTILSQSNPDQNNFLINHANNIFKQLQNSL
ncbi:unnamed protein product [Caenorhabditis angaria]|uniref:C2H2-type domain-containing protein n=1 Tax=Caenorhabditis angaria TaxID=860376 RepID=A0A9P1IKN6_9PELO|nr:unnamed protein product [Caenorhabditis angaria]